MLFNSFQFFLFFVVVYTLYLLLNIRWQNFLLIAASCLFYAAWNWKFLFLMFTSISTDYWCSQFMGRTDDPKQRRKFLYISLVVNLGILGFFKYFNFFTGNALALLHCFHWIPPSFSLALKIILPVGVSFYTFEAISYIVDVYRGRIKPADSYWDYVLFVIYFPHLIAGPIMRARDFLPQITSKRILSWDKFYEGSHLFFWGLFEKVFVADNLAKIVNPVFSGSAYEGGAVWAALYAFAFQIFCDFDGYSNMARGLGKCMGFEITINFKTPYFSRNPREFWQRWHISLSSWLRDYIYIPLGGNRQGEARMYGALILTMFLGGLWHGASWTFIVWGLYQAMLLIAHRLVTKDVKNDQGSVKERGMVSAFKIVIFFHLVVLGWVFFRAQSLNQVMQMLHALFFNLKPDNQDIALWLRLAGFLSPLLLIQIWQYKSNDLMIVYKQNMWLKTALYAFLTYLFIGWGVMKPEEFIYFQFLGNFMRAFFRCVLFFVFLEIFLRMGGEVSTLIQDYENHLRNKNPNAYRILCIGDSMTYEGGNDAYPVQLENLLNQGGKDKAFEVINQGTPASTTANTFISLKGYIESNKPNMVIAMFGANDNQETVAIQEKWLEAVEISLGNIRLVRTARFIGEHIKSELRLKPQNSQGVTEVPIGAGHDNISKDKNLKEALEKDPSNPSLLMALIIFYQNKEDFVQMETYCRLALSALPQDSPMKLPVLNLLAGALKEQKKFAESENDYLVLLRFAANDPGNRYQTLDSLVNIFLEEGDFEKAKIFLIEQLKMDPIKAAYEPMIHYYSKAGRGEEIEEILKGVLHVLPEDSSNYLSLVVDLGYVLIENRKYSEAENIFERALTTGLASMKESQSKENTDKYYFLANRARKGLATIMKLQKGGSQSEDWKEYYLPVTAHNYLAIKDMILSKGIAFVAVQYPLRPILPLKEILKKDKRVIFVDNAPSFENAVAASNYDEYFKDRFAGDFGHCTNKGYHLLAANVLKAILNKCKSILPQ